MTDPVGILTDLKKRITDDFPEIPDVNYNIKYVSKALEDYTSPAMYFIPQLDNLDINSIYINSSGTSASELYPTLAHEGYPGHMYQTQYFAATNPDWIRYIIAPGGYVEGWASYVEVLSYNYAQTGNDTLNKMYAANYATVLCLYAKGILALITMDGVKMMFTDSSASMVLMINLSPTKCITHSYLTLAIIANMFLEC